MSQFHAGVKPRAPIFTFDAVSDNSYMKTSNSPRFDPDHPLRADEDRLNRILNVMYAKIHKTLFPWSKPGRRSGSEASQSNNADDPELILEGTGVSANDVLSEACEGLLLYPPERLHGTWEGLAVTIAENKATDALRSAGKGLHGTDHRTPLRLVSGDLERKGPDGETEPAIFDTLPGNWCDPEAEFFVLDDVLKLRNLAREFLDDRDLGIFFAIHFDGDSRKEVGARFGLTGQRVSQIYNAALSTLEAHPDYPFRPLMEIEQLTTWRNQ